MVLTAAMLGRARDSRLWMNYRQNRRAGDEPEGNRSEQDEFLHGDLFQAGHAARGNISNVV
jgi:hypothetical protein